MAKRQWLIQRREDKGYSQNKLAKLVGAHRGTVYRWENGKQGFHGYQRRRLAIALGVTLELLNKEEAAYQESLATDGAALPAPDSVEDVERRELLAVLGGSFAGSVIAPAAVFATAKDVPPGLAGYFADQLAHHYVADTRLGARPLLDTVATQYSLVRRAADAARPGTRGELLRVGVGYANFAGWLHEDMGDLTSSRQWRSEALELAHQTEDPNLVAFVLSGMAFLRLDVGDGRGAVDSANAALDTPGLSSDTIRLYALRYAAEARSLVDDRDGVDQALDEAANLLDHDTDHRYPWAAEPRRVPCYIQTRQATCYGRLGNSSEAADLWQQVLDQHPTTTRRNRGIYLSRYATALLDVEGPDAALAPAAEAVECFHQVGSARMRRELTGLRDKASLRQDSASGNDLYNVLQAVA